MNKTLENGWENYKGLYNMMLSSTKNVMTVKNLLQSFKETTESYAKQVENIAENFHKEISSETSDSDALMFYYQYMSNYLLKCSQESKSLAINMHTEVIEPFELFVSNFRQTNRTTATKGKQLLIAVEDSRVDTLKMQEDYLKLAKAAEKTGEQIEKTIALMDKGTKTQQDLQKVSDKSVKLKMIAQEAEQGYKIQMDTCNKCWKKYEDDFQTIFTSFDYNDESRIAFSKQTIQNLIKQISKYSGEKSASDIQFEQKLEEYEENNHNVQENKIPCIKKLLKGQEESVLNAKYEEFLSYEQHKKQESEQLLEDDFEIIGTKSLSEKDKKRIDQIVDNIVDEKEIILGLLNSSHGSRRNIKLKEEEQKQEQQQLEQNEDNELMIFFKNSFKLKKGRQYFLDTFWKKMHTIKQFNFICFEDKFQELEEILKMILLENSGEHEQDFSAEEFYGVLQISSRIIKVQKNHKVSNSIHQNREHLSTRLNNLKIFQIENNWFSLYDFIFSKKTEEKIKMHKLLSSSQYGGNGNGNNFIKGGVKKGFSLVTKGIGFGLNALGLNQEQQQQKQQLQQQQQNGNSNNNNKDNITNNINVENHINEEEINEINYLILKEVNTFLLNLRLSAEFSSNTIINLATQKSGSNQQIQDLLEKQQDNKNNEFRSSFYSYKTRKNRIEDKQSNFTKNPSKKVIYMVKLSLPYLSCQDKPWNLQLVSRDFRKNLEKKIFKMYLLRDQKNNLFLNLNRVNVYKAWLKTELFDLKYDQIKQEMIEEGKKLEKQSRIEEIIDLDVKRSLHIHKDDISQETLQNLLKTFTHGNKVISYCQGMNYIAGFLYLTIRDESETYKQMHIIMNMYFQDLFTNQFQRLKIMFYQLQRCMSIFLPRLSDHFKNEGIDPQYYATGWFITIFTSVFQYTLSSHMLQVIWDIFIIEGWKGYFKCILFILKTHQQALLTMQFDEILNYLGEIIKSEFFGLGEQDLKERGVIDNVENVKAEIMKFDITQHFLNDIEKEFECFQLKLNTKLKNRKASSDSNNSNKIKK